LEDSWRILGGFLEDSWRILGGSIPLIDIYLVTSF